MVPGRLSNAGWLVTDKLAFTEYGVLLTKMAAALPKATGLRDTARGTLVLDLLWDLHVHTLGQSLWEPRSQSPQNSGSWWSYPGDSQEGNTAPGLTAEAGVIKRPSGYLTVLWLQQPLFWPRDHLSDTNQRKILTFLRSVRD